VTALAIDTATEACSAALWHEGQVYHRYEVAPRQHASLILPMIESLLSEAACQRADIEWIAFGQGPGAFTGVRIAAGVAHGLASGLACGLMPVSTLAALAAQAGESQPEAPVLSCIDARMGEVYWGVYQLQAGFPLSLAEERVCRPEAVTAEGIDLDRAVAIGSGWTTYETALSDTLGGHAAHIIQPAYPHARHMLAIARGRLAQGEPLQGMETAQPVYLRDNVAKPGK